MTCDTDELWKYIDTIREDKPTNTDERIQYTKNVKTCYGIINNLCETDFEYIESLLKKCFWDYRNLIIGHQFSKSLSSSQCKRIKKNYQNKCAVCGLDIESLLEVHHIIPKKLCGKNDDSNGIALCPTCHVIFHDIEGNGFRTEIKNYLESNGYFKVVDEYTKHLFV
jgi:5-methylcytosine-specific restriction endonuclease McrA